MSADPLLGGAVSELKAAGIDTPRLDAEILLADCIGCRREDLYLDRGGDISAPAAARFAEFVNRRVAREPVARILGRKEFWSLEFQLNEATLIPRPESETLVETALRLVGPQEHERNGFGLLDLGTGSGCLLLALLSELPAATGLGTDFSDHPLDAARRNANDLGLSDRVRFEAADWHEAAGWHPPEAPFDLIVANPPYVTTSEFGTLEPEVRAYDPQPALDGGADGLAAYPPVVELAAAQLAAGGWLVLEIGCGQEAAIGDLMRVMGFQYVATARDLAGITRVIYGKKP